jgi:glutamate-1-semialdehyde aminotransferase
MTLANHLLRKKQAMYHYDDLKNASGPHLYAKAKQLFPGGTQLFSKRGELFSPQIWPAYFSRAQGCRVWDLDHREFLDMSIMGVGAAVLGYADPDVDAAVQHGIRNGITSTLNCPEEVELAELLIDLHPWAEQIRFARSGGEAIMVAIRIARAATGRDIVLFNGYHGWGDWYLAANLGETSALDGNLMPGLPPHGIPRALQGTSIPVAFENQADLDQKLHQYAGRVAAVIVEPARGKLPLKSDLEYLKAAAHKEGAVLIFDEITSGFRATVGGIHRLLEVNPDIAVFAKGIANGYPLSAVIGRRSVMEAATRTFISSTNWTERLGPIAALTTIKKFLNSHVAEKINSTGRAVKNIWVEAAGLSNLEIAVSGLDSLPNFSFSYENAGEISTYFTEQMLTHGILGFRQFKPSFAHGPEELKIYRDACIQVFAAIQKHGRSNLPVEEVAHSGFYRLAKE